MPVAILDGALLAAVTNTDPVVAPACRALAACGVSTQGALLDLCDGDSDVGDGDLVLETGNVDSVVGGDEKDICVPGRVDE